MFQVKSVEEVLSIIKNSFHKYELEDERISIAEATGRVTAENITAAEDTPGFHRSTVDGYAVKASDTFGASESLPIQLQLVEEVKMGEKPLCTIQPGQAAYIPTGGELPEGADAVVMMEYSEDLEDGYIYLNKSAAPGNHVIFRGDDTKAGEVVIKEGTVLTSRHIGVLASVGKQSLLVKRKLQIGILSTGDEVVSINEEISGSKVRDINSWCLYSSVNAWGANATLYGIVEDNYDEIRNSVSIALDRCDIVLISGGSSVGTRDETCNVIKSLGMPGILVHGIAVKPGKPTIIGKVGSKAVIGLPGHPASAYVIYKVFVEYLMDVMQRLESRQVNRSTAFMGTNYPSNNGREEFLPVKLENREGKQIAIPVFGKSGLMKMLAASDGYVRIPREWEGLATGQQVDVVLFD